jgi:RCC1 and BTB domain-containing protein
MITENGQLYGMGRNNFYQIGLPDISNYKKPTLVEALKDKRVVQVACGQEHCIVLTDEGSVYGMGRNSHYQLGNTKNTSQQPHLILALDPMKIKFIACGANHTMVINEEGKLYGFGQNNNGQIGYRDLTSQHVPRLVQSLREIPVDFVACGAVHTMVIAQGSLYAFGGDNCGQLGLGEQNCCQDVPDATLVTALTHQHIVKVACGGYFTLVLTEEGQVYSFGQNNHGQLGLGNTQNVASPTPITELEDIIDLAAGACHALLLNDEGKIFGMGQGNLFQNGSLASLSTPHEILSLRNANVNNISCGSNHCFVYFSMTGVKDLIPPTTLLNEIENTLNKEDFSDVTFIVEGKKIFAHKFILALRCEKFRRQFASGMKDARENSITITDVKYEHYLAFLKYLYTDRAEFNTEDAVELLGLANEHCNERLKRICEKKIKKGIDVDNAAYLLQMASLYNTPNLKRFCLNFMIKPENFDKVIKTDAFTKLDKELILEVLRARPTTPLSPKPLIRRSFNSGSISNSNSTAL